MIEYEQRQQRFVVCAAIRSLSGRIICGPRHFHCFRSLAEEMLGITFHDDWEQGFVDQKCEFMTRKEALNVAVECGQIDRKRRIVDHDELYSEDLY